MDNNTHLDDQLADLTDALLERGDFAPTEELAELGQIVRQLHSLIEPETKPPPAFRARLSERLEDEWHRQHRQKKTGGHIVRFRNLRLSPYIAVAAVIVVVLLAALLLNQQEPTSQTGTAASSDGESTGVSLSDLIYIGIGVGAALAVGYAYIRFRRK